MHITWLQGRQSYVWQSCRCLANLLPLDWFVLCDIQLICTSRPIQFLPFLHHVVSVAYLWPAGLQEWWLRVVVLPVSWRIISEHFRWIQSVSGTWVGIELSWHASCCLPEFFGLATKEVAGADTVGLLQSQASCLAQTLQNPRVLEQLLLFLVSELCLNCLSSPFCSGQGLCFKASAIISILNIVCRISSADLLLRALTVCTTQ